MNRYPLWKYIVVVVALIIGVLYTLPNFFGETPAVQVSPIRATIKSDDKLLQQVTAALAKNGISSDGAFLDTNGVKVRLPDTDTQLKARDVLEHAFNPKADDAQYVVALNLLSASPTWLTSIHPLPLSLGLDLRGGVHFLLQVDLQGALTKRIDATSADIRTLLRDKNIRHAGISREDQRVVIRFRETDYRSQARGVLLDSQPDLIFTEQTVSGDPALVGAFKPEAIKRIQEFAVKQNITTLHNRINELGVAEPIIQQSGPDRIVVQLPGVQDTAKAKDILGRTATLEIRMVDDTPGALDAALAGNPPFGTEVYTERGGQPLLVKKQVVLTGDRLNDAQPGFDNQTQEPAVHLNLDSAGARIFKDVTRENVGKRMAILLIEKGKGEVITAPVIRTEIGGGRVQISGRMTTSEANAIALFMIIYYQMFGVISTLALASNLLFLVAILSLLQATLTLPGIAAIALTLGMAIDANVLINERIREELRAGMPPQAAISEGYERAFSTILDSNITTLIAGLALLIFGSGPVRGFAVVHCLGILTSIFSSVVVSRALVNLIYGRQKKLAKVAIGQLWKPGNATVTGKN